MKYIVEKYISIKNIQNVYDMMYLEIIMVHILVHGLWGFSYLCMNTHTMCTLYKNGVIVYVLFYK